MVVFASTFQFPFLSADILIDSSSQEAVIVIFSLAGNATPTVDYVENLSTFVVIPDGQTSVAMTVTTIDDSLVETSETVDVTLQPSPAYTIDATDFSGTVTITDDDTFVVTLEVTDAVATEQVTATSKAILSLHARSCAHSITISKSKC